MKKYPITSYWKNELGEWDYKSNSFINRKFSELEVKKIYIEYDKNTDIIHFHGGPTGCESYLFSFLESSFLPHNKNKLFCICGGTINSWPTCHVNMDEFLKIFNEIKKHRNA